MKHLTISSLLLLALCAGVRAGDAKKKDSPKPKPAEVKWTTNLSASPASAAVVGQYISLLVTDSKADVGKQRLELKERCAKDKAECWLLVIEKDGKRLATIDLDGKWAQYGSQEDIANTLATVFSGMIQPQREATK